MRGCFRSLTPPMRSFAFWKLPDLSTSCMSRARRGSRFPPFRWGSCRDGARASKCRRGIENLPYYRHRVAELLESLPLRRDERYDVALALGEALGNAYDHAGGVGCILTVQAYGDRVVLEVLDRGAGYSIDGASEPVTSEERGRGIKLMRMLVDNVEVARRTDGAGTRVRMVKLFSSALESCA